VDCSGVETRPSKWEADLYNIYAKLRSTFYGDKWGCLSSDCRGESYAV